MDEPKIDLNSGSLVIGTLSYLIEVDPEAAGSRPLGIVLRRLDGMAGPYQLSKAPGRLWRCSCPSYRYRKGSLGPYGCKHVHAVKQLIALVDRLSEGKEETMAVTTRKKNEPAPAPVTAVALEAHPPAPEVPELIRIAAALAAPFPASAIGWKPQSISGGRALALAYIDARDVMDRLDAVVGLANWQDSYHENADGTVCCTLELRLGGEWLSRCDVGGESDQKDAGDRKKAAYSDALKRAAVKWGIGRYLYSLPATWVEYDAQKRTFIRTPSLPAWALPGGRAELPGPDFARKLHEYDSSKGYGGTLVKAVATLGKTIGAPADLTLWDSDQVAAAREETRRFEAARQAG